MVEVSTQCSEGSPSYPDRTRHSVVHGCIKHQLGSTLECSGGVRCLDNNRENTSHQHTRVRSHALSHAPLAYGSDSPGCVRHLHCSVLHQQAGRIMANTAVQTDQHTRTHHQPRVLVKALQDQCELIVIAPHWPQAIWFPLLLRMLVQSPLRIPNIPRLISQP